MIPSVVMVKESCASLRTGGILAQRNREVASHDIEARAFPKLAHTKRTCSSTHPDSRLRGNDGMRFSGQWKGPALKLVNWNVEWATPGSQRTPEILNRVRGHDPQVVCLTETHDGLLSQGGHTICSQPDYGYPIRKGRRKVLLWSRSLAEKW